MGVGIVFSFGHCKKRILVTYGILPVTAVASLTMTTNRHHHLLTLMCLTILTITVVEEDDQRHQHHLSSSSGEASHVMTSPCTTHF